MKTALTLIFLISHLVDGSPQSKRGVGCNFIDSRDGDKYPGTCETKTGCDATSISQSNSKECGSDKSLVCCARVNFQCEDKTGLFKDLYCQNVESGCDGGQFYDRQEQDPNMCPGPPSEIRCCVPDATSPLTPKTQEEEPPPDEEPQEPIQSLGGGSELSMLPDTGPLSQDEWGLMQSNFEPAGNLQANLLSEDAFGISFAPSPSFDHTFDPGLFDVASLPATPENEFTAFLDDHQFSQDSFSTQNSLFAMGPDSEENLWNS